MLGNNLGIYREFLDISIVVLRLMKSESLIQFKEATDWVPRPLFRHVTLKISKRIKDEKNTRLLLYLIGNYAKGALATEGVPKIVQDFYQVDISGDAGQKSTWNGMEWPNHPGKKALGTLRNSLQEYRKNEGKNDKIVVLLVRQGRGTIMKITGVEFPSDAIGSARRRIEVQFPRVDCFYVGNDEKGMEYVIEQMPELRSFRDTHVRPKEDSPKYYKDESLDQFKRSLKAFLNRKPENEMDPENKLMLIAGQTVEERYITAYNDATEEHKDKIQCYRLRYPGSWLNFIILEYADRGHAKEVLFGWGRQDPHYDEGVFISDDKRLVDEFDALFWALIDPSFSERVSDLGKFFTQRATPVQTSEPTGILQIFPTFAATPVFEEIEKCKGTGDGKVNIRLITPGISEMRLWADSLSEALKNGACVQILRSHPESAFAKTRESVLMQGDYVMGKSNQEILRELKTLGKLEVKLTSEFLSNSYVQLNDLIYFGMFWSYESTFDGPFLLTRADSIIGRSLARQYDRLWRRADPFPKKDA
jgi:hypothetical protein